MSDICIWLKCTIRQSLTVAQVSAAKKLLLTIDVINETVGDAISDMLLVETILLANGWDVRDWLNTYDDLPNCLRKVKVADRTAFTTANAERQCVTPIGLQVAIDRTVEKFPRGRSFVRASGTEDVVRVYAEAGTTEVMMAFICKLRHDFYEFLLLYFLGCGKVG